MQKNAGIHRKIVFQIDLGSLNRFPVKVVFFLYIFSFPQNKRHKETIDRSTREDYQIPAFLSTNANKDFEKFRLTFVTKCQTMFDNCKTR